MRKKASPPVSPATIKPWRASNRPLAVCSDSQPITSARSWAHGVRARGARPRRIVCRPSRPVCPTRILARPRIGFRCSRTTPILRPRPRILFIILAVLIVAGGAVTVALFGRFDRQAPLENRQAFVMPSDPARRAELIRRGEYLARAGDCIACHTTRGGQPFAGGLAMPTPFGTLYTPNITPDDETGIGAWSAEDFYRAMHAGRGKDGRLLYPAFPFPSYTRVARADSDAIYAYLRSQAAVHQPNRPNEMQFPFSFRPMLIGWRLLFFSKGEFRPDPAQSAQWNRGAYLVEG